MRALLLTLLCFAPACAKHRYFQPRDFNGVGPDGHPAAVYVVQGEGVKGRVWVWSAGSRPGDEAGDGAVLHVGLELENTGQRPLRIDRDALLCEQLQTAELEVLPFQPTRFAGNAEAGPGRMTRLDAWFEPGPGIGPRDFPSFAVRFVVRSAEQEVYRQATPFVPYVGDTSRQGDDSAGGFFVGGSRGSAPGR